MVSAVIAASPMPISRWTPTMAVATLPIETSVVPPIQNRSVNARAAAGTDTTEATKEAAVIERRVFGRTFTRPRKTT